MSCKLIDFYKSLSNTEKNSAKYQDDPTCYYYNPFEIVGRINAYSATLFTIDQKNVEDSGNGYIFSPCPYYICVKQPVYNPNVDDDELSCNNDLFYSYDSSYTVTERNYYAICYVSPPLCEAGVYADYSENKNAFCQVDEIQKYLFRYKDL